MQITNASQLTGVFPALFTPLKNDDPKNLRNSIDYKKMGQMIDDVIANGASGVLPAVTTGQSATVSPQQHLDVIKFTLDYVDGRVPVIAGAGSNCTRESIEMIENVQKIAPVAVLCVTGYYNNPPQEGLLKHYRTLSSETGAKIVIYNVPGRTSSYVHPDTLIELAEDKNIIGLKQAVEFGFGEKFHEDTMRVIKETKGKDFAVMSGEDGLFADLLEMGGTGLISASGNIPEATKTFVALYKAFQAGAEERRNHYFGNLDIYRNVTTNTFMADFEPQSKFFRYDPDDNQRGEVEDSKRGYPRWEVRANMEMVSVEEIQE